MVTTPREGAGSADLSARLVATTSVRSPFAPGDEDLDGSAAARRRVPAPSPGKGGGGGRVARR